MTKENGEAEKIITSISPVFERDLQKGMEHPDVKRLQQLLNFDPETQVASTGDGSPGQETEFYGNLTEGAVRRFQAKHGVVSFGHETRKAMVEAYEYEPETDESKGNADAIKKAPDKIPPEARVASVWAISMKGKVFQPCETPGCLYNYDPKQKGKEACKNPTREADRDDIKRGNHKDRHPYWFFYCGRFAQHAYDLRGKDSARVMYNELKRKGVVNNNSNVPVGAFIFWDLSKHGHVGICSGNEKVIHTGLKETLREEGVREDPISEISEKKYLGWAYPPEDWLV